MSFKWRVYCLDPSDIGWQYTWSDTKPTVCPNNVSHSINNQSISVIQTEIFRYQLNPIMYNTNNIKLQRICLFYYPTTTIGKLLRIKIISRNERSSENHIFEIYDITNQVSLYTSSPIITTLPDQIHTLGPINLAPTNDVLIEVNVKSSNKNNIINIDKILIFSG